MSSGDRPAPSGTPAASRFRADVQRQVLTLAHDFNNLLTTIVGYANLLARSLDDGDPRRGDAEEIIASAQRASELVRQLGELGREAGAAAGERDDAAADAGSHAPPAAPDTASPVRILVVDDERPVRYLVRTILGRAGYDVHEAATAADAETLMSASSRIDLLISDFALPERSGPELAQRLRARQPGLKVLFISGYSDAHARGQALDPDIPFVQKPFTGEILTDAVQQLIGR